MVKTELRTLHCGLRVKVCFNSKALQISCLLSSFGSLSKSIFTKCYNCLEINLTIIHLLQQSGLFLCKGITVSSMQISILFTGKMGYPTCYIQPTHLGGIKPVVEEFCKLLGDSFTEKFIVPEYLKKLTNSVT